MHDRAGSFSLVVLAKYDSSRRGSVCFQAIREAKGTRIKTFQSGLFRPTGYLASWLAFASPLRRNWKNTEENGKLETPRRPGKMVHRKLGLAPSNFAYQKCLDRKRIEESDASHPNTNSSPQKTPLNARALARGMRSVGLRIS